MARKKKPVVRRQKGPTQKRKGPTHGARKPNKSSPKSRTSGVARHGNKGGKRTRPQSKKPTVRRAKAREHETRKRRSPRIQPKRKKHDLKKPPNKRKGPAKRAPRGAPEGYEPIERPTRPRERFDDEEDYEEFRGPPGDSYDDAFDEIDWAEFDWDDLIDDFGDEEEDDYGSEPR